MFFENFSTFFENFLKGWGGRSKMWKIQGISRETEINFRMKTEEEKSIKKQSGTQGGVTVPKTPKIFQVFRFLFRSQNKNFKKMQKRY